VEAGHDITVVLADDDRVTRVALRLLLQGEPGVAVVGEVADAKAALAMIEARRPDVLILGLTFPDRRGLSGIPDLAERTRVVVLTLQDDPGIAREALQLGAAAYVLMGEAEAELADAVRAAAAGDRYLSPSLGARLVAAPPVLVGPPDSLTERELDILRLIALGHTNMEISQHLFLSVRTIESHRAHVQHKTGHTTRAELVRYALDHGLVDTS
jgi:two-component system response regulator NreC